MRTMKWTFMLLAISGCFPPALGRTPCKNSLYSVYSFCSLLTLYTWLFSQLLDLVLNVQTTADFSDNFVITIEVFITCFKVIVILIRRKNIERLIAKLQKEPFLPTDEQEFEIQARFENITGWNTIGFVTMLLVCQFWICIRSLYTDFPNRKLPFRAWLPYDYSSKTVYLLTYVHQSIAASVCCICSASSDSLYSGFLIYTYEQFELLEFRLNRNIKHNQSNTTKECVRHHNRIYEFAKEVNGNFKSIVLVQFCGSISVLCFNLYQLTTMETGDSRFMETALYLLCTLTQIFYYCWYGNEVKLKSLQLIDAIFASDWVSVNNNTKKTLLILMQRALKPTEFSSIYIVTVNLECFMAILKSSYSAFNLFQ